MVFYCLELDQLYIALVKRFDWKEGPVHIEMDILNENNIAVTKAFVDQNNLIYIGYI